MKKNHIVIKDILEKKLSMISFKILIKITESIEIRMGTEIKELLIKTVILPNTISLSDCKHGSRRGKQYGVFLIPFLRSITIKRWRKKFDMVLIRS